MMDGFFKAENGSEPLGGFTHLALVSDGDAAVACWGLRWDASARERERER